MKPVSKPSIVGRGFVLLASGEKSKEKKKTYQEAKEASIFVPDQEIDSRGSLPGQGPRKSLGPGATKA